MTDLTSRQRDILDLLADGCTNRQIADRLLLSQQTVRNRVTELLQQLDMPNRTTAAVWWALLQDRERDAP